MGPLPIFGPVIDLYFHRLCRICCLRFRRLIQEVTV